MRRSRKSPRFRSTRSSNQPRAAATASTTGRSRSTAIDGTKIRGQLARPKVAKQNDAGEKLPALFIPQWAGVYPIEKAGSVDRAAEGWLVLNVLAHDLADRRTGRVLSRAGGRTSCATTGQIGNDDRETSYFLRMYLSCYQAVEYLRSRPDWDGKTLVVAGASQGGQQTLVSAALASRRDGGAGNGAGGLRHAGARRSVARAAGRSGTTAPRVKTRRRFARRAATTMS